MTITKKKHTNHTSKSDKLVFLPWTSEILLQYVQLNHFRVWNAMMFPECCGWSNHVLWKIQFFGVDEEGHHTLNNEWDKL